MKKKYGLFTILTIMTLLIVVATYFIPGRENSIQYLALGDVFLNYIQSFYYFFDIAIFILVVGGFYGFLNRVPAYKKIVNSIADKFSNRSKLFVIITTIIFALLASLTGLNLLLLLFIPFLVSIILVLGYDKLVAISATIGGTIAGLIGGIFLTVKDASNYYEVSYTTIDKLVGLESHWGNLFPKILLLVVVTGLLIFYIISHIKKVENKETKYKLTKSDNLFVEVKDRKGKVIEVENTKVRVWPLVVVLFALLVILVLGYFPWNSLFKIDCFSKFHETITKVTFKDGKYVIMIIVGLLSIFSIYKLIKTIKNDGLLNKKSLLWILIISIELFILTYFGIYTFKLIKTTAFGSWIIKSNIWESSIFTTLISSTLVALGSWNELGGYLVAILVLTIIMFIIKIIYKLNFEDAMDGFNYGVKKMIPAVMISMLAFCVLVCCYNNGFTETIIKNAGKEFGDNAVIHSLITFIGSIFHVDFYYTSTAIFTPIASSLTENANLSIYAVMFQSIYGLAQLVGPTSILLIVGLSYLEVPYKTWLKYIWRFIVELIIVILIALMIVSLL